MPYDLPVDIDIRFDVAGLLALFHIDFAAIAPAPLVLPRLWPFFVTTDYCAMNGIPLPP
jgi:hypothetical protein